VSSQFVAVSKSPPKGDVDFVVEVMDVHHTSGSDHDDSLKDLPSFIYASPVAE